MLHRYYYEGEFSPGDKVLLESTEGHHLTRVVRALAGQQVALVNGKGVLAIAAVLTVRSGIAELEVTAVEKEPMTSHPLVLVQALPRLPRLDFIVEKATELGASAIVLFPGEKSERRAVSEHQWQRIRAITVSAMKQCGRLYLPELLWWPSIAKWQKYEGRGYFGDVTAEAPKLIDIWLPPPVSQPIAFCIGPESGLSAVEVRLLRERGWQGVKLHQNILRTDTAPLVALSLLSHLL